MSAPFKIFAGKGITVKLTFAPETPFSFLIPVNNQCHQLNALYGLGKINKSFGIAGSYLVFLQVIFRTSNEDCIILIKHFHPVQQYMTRKPEPVFQEIIEEFIMHSAML